jgi:hypothetical protein
MIRSTAALAAAFLSLATLAAAQDAPATPSPTAVVPPQADSQDAMAAQIRELRTALDAVRDQLAASHREADALRQELQAVRDQLDSLKRASGPADRIDAMAEELELLSAKVEDQEQTKVDSGSKHHVRLSGLVLLNVVSTNGSVDNIDLPGVALARPPGDSGGSFGASARQSFLGLEVFGPTLGGAKTAGSIAFDFFGGFPVTHDGVTAPLVRLRTATFTLDWKKASVMAGQDVPFFSPRSPTSLASTAYPALSSAGNVWAWTLQVHVDHRLALPGDSTMMVQWGFLDPLTGELPAHEYNRMATAGERSRVPAQAVRVAWQRGADSHLLSVGAGGYHAAQDWGFGRTVDAWSAAADWDVALGRWFTLSGEWYRGQAMGGLGGGASESVLFGGPPAEAASAVHPVESTGGWSQLKFKPASRLELNAAFGEDNPSRAGFSQLVAIGSVDESAVNRNASAFLNAIFQARSNLLFSVEYRRLWTTGLDDVMRTADHVSVSAGIVF